MLGAVANHTTISDSPIDFKNYAHKERSLLKINRDGHTKPEVDEKSTSVLSYSPLSNSDGGFSFPEQSP